MARFDAGLILVALSALLVACGESRQPGPPAVPAVPEPVAAPPATKHPSLTPKPATPTPEPPPALTPVDSGKYIWQSGPIAAP